MIHDSNDEQDIRTIGGLWKAVSFTATSLVIGSLAGTGRPCLTGFHSKDLMMETPDASNTNA
eukprot:bmy_20067T0